MDEAICEGAFQQLCPVSRALQRISMPHHARWSIGHLGCILQGQPCGSGRRAGPDLAAEAVAVRAVTRQHGALCAFTSRWLHRHAAALQT